MRRKRHLLCQGEIATKGEEGERKRMNEGRLKEEGSYALFAFWTNKNTIALHSLILTGRIKREGERGDKKYLCSKQIPQLLHSSRALQGGEKSPRPS